jgi:hypothetical protein
VQATVPELSGVKNGLTPNRQRRPVENNEYASFICHVIRAYVRRVPAGDVDAFADMTGLAAELDEAISRAVTGSSRCHPAARVAASPAVSDCRSVVSRYEVDGDSRNVWRKLARDSSPRWRRKSYLIDVRRLSRGARRSHCQNVRRGRRGGGGGPAVMPPP